MIGKWRAEVATWWPRLLVRLARKHFEADVATLRGELQAELERVRCLATTAEENGRAALERIVAVSADAAWLREDLPDAVLRASFVESVERLEERVSRSEGYGPSNRTLIAQLHDRIAALESQRGEDS